MRRGGNDRRVREERPLHQLADFERDDFARGLVHEVGLGERDEAAAHAEELEDFEVLAGLGHDRIVGRDDEQREVDAGGPGEHVLDEPLVAGHVHDAQSDVAEVEVGEPDVDGDAAGLLLREPVAVGAGERLDQRRLAVVDVPGGAEDEVARHGASGVSGGE